MEGTCEANISAGASLSGHFAPCVYVSRRKKVGEEASLHQPGSCQKKSLSPRPSVYCSLSWPIFCYIMHQADPRPTDSVPGPFVGFAPWASDWAAGGQALRQSLSVPQQGRPPGPTELLGGAEEAQLWANQGSSATWPKHNSPVPHLPWNHQQASG